MKPAQLPEELGMYVDRLREQHATLDQVWVLAGPGETSGDAVWELLGFGDERVLEAIRADERVHRDDVDLKIVVDGDRRMPSRRSSTGKRWWKN